MTSPDSLAPPLGAALGSRAVAALPVPLILRAEAAGVVLVGNTCLFFEIWSRRGCQPEMETLEPAARELG